MKNKLHKSLLFSLLIIVISCTSNKKEDIININEVSPWCILGFDSLNRTPEQRISMLKKLGLKKYGYNKGKGDLISMKKEFQLANENEIQITSIFLWLNANRDSIGKLSSSNQKIIDNLKDIEEKPTIWVSFSDNFFKNLNQEESIELAIKMLKFIKLKANEINCEIAIYNHHGWFGNPYNQIEILQRLSNDSIKMIYNFHHAHEYIDNFPKIAKIITPYISHVNINGMKKEGAKILTIGAGDYEYDMIKTLLTEGYSGSWGILGHIKDEDVEKVLKRNIKGLSLLNKKLK